MFWILLIVICFTLVTGTFHIAVALAIWAIAFAIEMVCFIAKLIFLCVAFPFAVVYGIVASAKPK